MSDYGRKNISNKASETVRPDSDKTTFERAKEKATGKTDQMAAEVTPENQKSFTQTLSDKTQKGYEEATKAVNKDQGTMADTAAQYVDAAKESVANAAQYVSSVVGGTTEGAKTGAETGAEATKKQ